MPSASLLRSLGGRIETGVFVRSLADLPAARLYLFDTSPAQLAEIAAPVLPARYLRRLGRYRYGPGVFKLDWALDGSIPWRDPRCLEASTVHLGGTLEEIAAAEAAVWRGEHPEHPYVLLAQQSEIDRSRAPEGKQTGWAYCHVPPGSTRDLTAIVERQVERFAPGFTARILARHVTTTADLERYNANYVGGAITGGVADLHQFFARPVARLNPYTTPNPRVLLCSASTPPGGGVHGMCGYHAARVALRRMGRFGRVAASVTLVVAQPTLAGAQTLLAGAMGSAMRKRVPPPSRDWQVTLPPCDSTMWRVIARPRPVPSPFVEKKGSKTRPRIASGTPPPRSSTSTTTLMPSAATLTRSAPRPAWPRERS